jgi:hypothetical protein
MNNFIAKVEHVGGFMVRAEWLDGWIDVIAANGRGIQYGERFSAADGRIHDQHTLESLLAQWKRNNWQKVV